MYESEAKFSRSLIAQMKSIGFDVTRIESHSTGNGIPDMFVEGNGIDFWLELKNSKTDSNKVAWRPGQQAWMRNYFLLHQTKCCLTLKAMPSGVMVVPMIDTYNDNLVSHSQVVSWQDWRELKKGMELARFFSAMTDCTFHRQGKWQTSARTLLCTFADWWFHDVDFDPDVFDIPDDANWIWLKQHQMDIYLTLLHTEEQMQNQQQDC